MKVLAVVVALLLAAAHGAHLAQLVLRDLGGTQDAPIAGVDNIAFLDNVQVETSGLVSDGNFLPENAADGFYGPGSEARAAEDGAFIGFDWKANDDSPFELAAVAWSRDNTGAVSNFTAGEYQVWVAKDPVAAVYEHVATITYDESTFRGHIRHLYEFQGGPEEVQDTLSRATGVRLVLQEGVVVDEFEAYTRESLDALTRGGDCGTLLIQTGVDEVTPTIPYSVRSASGSHDLVGVITSLFDLRSTTFVSVDAGGPQPAYMGAVFESAIDDVSAITIDAVVSVPDVGSFIIQVTHEQSASVADDADWVTLGRAENVNTDPEHLAHQVYQFECEVDPIWGYRVLVPILTPISQIGFIGPPATDVEGFVRNQVFAVDAPTDGGFVTVEGTDNPYGVFLTADQEGAVFSPNPVVANLPGEEKGVAFFTTQCGETGALTVSFGTQREPDLYGSQRALCAGSSLISDEDAPASVERGEDFTITLNINPPAAEPIEFTVDLSNELVVPFSPRMYFGVGQSTSSLRFRAEPINFVGDVEITFRPVRQRTYTTVVHTVRVLGHMIPTLAEGQVVADGVTTVESVLLIPPTPLTTITDNANNVDNDVDVVVAIDSAVGPVFPVQLEYITGVDTRSFEFTPLVAGPGSVTFTSDFYVPVTLELIVEGGFFSSAPQELVATSSSTFRVSVKPQPTEPLTVTVELDGPVAFGAESTGVLEFDQFDLTREVTIVGVEEVGTATVSFSAAGFVTHTDTIAVVATPTCIEDLEVLAANGATCAVCPVGLDGDVCSDNGVCVPSIITDSATCGCLLDTAGPTCSHLNTSPRLQESFIGATVSNDPGTLFIGFAETDTYIIFEVAANSLDNVEVVFDESAAELFGFLFVDLDIKSIDGAVDPTEVLPVVDGAIVSHLDFTYNDFFLDFMYFDQTRLAEPFAPIWIEYDFERLTLDELISALEEFAPNAFIVTDFGERNLHQVTSHDMNRLWLYRYSTTQGQWVPAEQGCGAEATSDLRSLRYRSPLCWSGQYAFFLRDAIPVVTQQQAQPITAAPVPLGPVSDDRLLNANTQTTTGQTGLQVELPEDPSFADDLPEGEPRRSALNSAAAVAYSLALTVGVVCASVLM